MIKDLRIFRIAILELYKETLFLKKSIFECYPNYSVTLRSKNIEDTFNLQFKLLADMDYEPGNDALSFYYIHFFKY